MTVYSFKDKPKRLNRHLIRSLKREGGITMKALLDVVEHEATLSRLRKPKNKQRKPRARNFSPSRRLQGLGKEMLLARKIGQRQCFLSLRKQYCKLLRFEKRKAFQLYKEEVILQPEIREFCRLMDRLRPQKSWCVNVGDHREDEIGVNLLRIQSERPSSTRFQETQLLRLSCADVEDRHDQEPCFDMHDFNSALVTCCFRKSPGPSGLLQPKVLQALTTILSQEFRTLNTRKNLSESTSNVSQRKHEIDICALCL